MAEGKSSVNPLAAIVAGMVVGAASGAAAVALKDKKNRAKALKQIATWRQIGEKALEDLRGKVSEINEETQKALETGSNKKSVKKTKTKES